MTNEQILEGNKLIAEFMGYELNKYDYYLFPGLLPQFRGSDHAEWCSTQEIQIDWDNLKDIELYEKTGGYYWEISSNHLCYESSWNWLMPVVEKIEDLFIPNELTINIVIETDMPFCISVIGKNKKNFRTIGNSKIESVWLGVIEFIKWYNKQEKI